MRILHVAGYGVKIGVTGTALNIKARDGSKKIPLSEIDVVVLASSGISISSRALRKLVTTGIEVIVVDDRGLPVGILYASHYTRTTATRRAQYQAYTGELAVSIASSIARCKILTQASTLRRLSVDLGVRELAEEARRVKAKASSIDLNMLPRTLEEARSVIMGVEAEAARIYWGSIALILPRDIGFNGRDRDSIDPFNLSLNYAYGILYGLAWRSLVLAGLDPYAGFLHTDRSGKPVLAFDYVEMWRAPLIDEVLVRAFMRGWRPRIESGRLSYNSRAEIAGFVSERLKQVCPGAYRHMTFDEALRGYALRLAESLRRGAPYQCYEGEAT
jgi:CRISPR-associated protein Cas1